MDPSTTTTIISNLANNAINSTRFDWLGFIISPIIVGAILAWVQYKLDKKKQEKIDIVVEKANSLDRKIDAQKILIDKVNSIEVQNRIYSMEIAKTLYGKLYSMYWKRFEGVSISPLFDDAKRYLYEYSIYLNENVIRAFFAVLLNISKIIMASATEMPECITSLDNAMEGLKEKLKEEYNLLGKITKLDIFET